MKNNYKISDKTKKILNDLSFEDIIYGLIKKIGEDPERDSLLLTPHRVVKSWGVLTSGYSENINQILDGAIFEENYNQMIVVKDIDFYSICEHHLLPFFGKCHIAYIPNKKIIGFSKIPKIVEHFSKRLQVQERLSQQIADTLNNILHPLGVAVVCEAQHLCMTMRGTEKVNSIATTSVVLGEFHNEEASRKEFFDLIKNKII